MKDQLALNLIKLRSPNKASTETLLYLTAASSHFPSSAYLRQLQCAINNLFVSSDMWPQYIEKKKTCSTDTQQTGTAVSKALPAIIESGLSKGVKQAVRKRNIPVFVICN